MIPEQALIPGVAPLGMSSLPQACCKMNFLQSV
jgi:hypothetical protein